MSQIIHIGFPKTGVTWFKKEFYPNIANHVLLNRDYIKKEILKKSINSKFNLEYCENIILCEENLLGDFFTSWVGGSFCKEVAFRLKQKFPNAYIVILIRNQYDIIASSYLQYIKNGGTYNIDNFLYHKRNHHFIQDINLFNFDFFDYNIIIDEYYKLFGDNFKIYLYEDFKKNPELFAEKLSKDLKIEITNINFSRKINQSNPNKVYYIKKLLNHFFYGKTIYKHYFVNIPYLEMISGKLLNLSIFLQKSKNISSKRILGQKNIEYIKNYYAKSNYCFKIKYNIDFKNYNYPLED